jgi:hypothetical protein
VVALKALVRYFSYVFNGLLALFLLAVSGLALASGAANLHLGMLPWSGTTLIYILLCGAVFGLIALVLAMRGTLAWLFFLWTLAVTVLLVKGYLFTGYHFAPGEATRAGYLTLASVIGMIGAWWATRAAGGRKDRY